MSLGVEVRNRTAPAARGVPVETDTLFLAWDGEGGTGTLLAPVECHSIADFVAVHGARASANQEAYDYLDNFFREGGRKAYTARHTTAGTIDAALDLFEDDGLGPGQLAYSGGGSSIPGATLYGKLLDAAAAYNRVALLDVNIDDTIAEMDTLADGIPSTNESYGALFGPWVTIPAPAGSGGSTRSVPASSTIAALCARVEALGNPNRAAAGRDFPLQYGLGFTVPVSDTDREALLDAGCNTFATKYGVLQNYGFQTGVAQSDSTPYWQFNCSRTRMWITARAKATGENYMFKPIDGRGALARSLQTDLDAILLELYMANGLYGLTPQEAFATEVGASVNTVNNIAQGTLSAVCEAKLNLHAKSVLIDLVSVPVTGQISA
jgi:hypothetical protein